MTISASLLVLVAALAAEPVKLAPGETLTLKEDLVLAPGDALEISGTAEKPCVIDGQGHSIRSHQCWVGKFALAHCKFKNLGASGIKPETPAIQLHVCGETNIKIEHCTFDECAGVHVYNNEKSTTAFNHNT